MRDDLIKRSDAIAEIYKVRTPDVVSHHYAELFINAVCRASEVKAIKKGQWIPNPFEPDWDYCTACRQGTKRREHGTDDGHEWVREYGYPFCPNCGADMRGEDDAMCDL